MTIQDQDIQLLYKQVETEIEQHSFYTEYYNFKMNGRNEKKRKNFLKNIPQYFDLKGNFRVLYMIEKILMVIDLVRD